MFHPTFRIGLNMALYLIISSCASFNNYHSPAIYRTSNNIQSKTCIGTELFARFGLLFLVVIRSLKKTIIKDSFPRSVPD